MRNDFKIGGRTFTAIRDYTQLTLSVDGKPVRSQPHESVSEAIECHHWVMHTLIEVEAAERGKDSIAGAASELVRVLQPLARGGLESFTVEQREAFWALTRALEK